MTIHKPTPRVERRGAVYLAEILDAPPSSDGDWGPWALDTDTTALFMPAGSGFYDIGLDQCRTEAGFLHWVAHLHDKTWVDARVLGGFVAAVDDVIGVQRLSAGTVSHVELADAILRASDRYPQVREGIEAER